ncbi:MAG: VacJ family lipoprotein [Candidatus Marinarcus sp.]|uniref:MlaA family lipoprotein n=1 Tax=Candidatus Marinarcus sp. TaxID=3100987 RepID=UPI003B001D5C
MRSLFFVILVSISIFAQEANLVQPESQQAQSNFVNDFSDEFETKDVEIFDPLSGYNRVMTNFNDGFYTNVLTPVARGYAYVIPEPARVGVSNVFDNLFFPIRFINNILQFKFLNASEELGRFVINSTFGLLGIMDVAKDLGLKAHKEDFGQTLGYYGVGSGFHVVIPFLGPSNVRDIFGLGVDSFGDVTSSNMAYEPYRIPNDAEETLGIKTFQIVNRTSLHLNEYENLKKDAIDLYPFLRDIYEQRRKKQIEE